MARGLSLENGHKLSCGCLNRDRVRKSVTKHSASADGKKTRLYVIWSAMRARCRNLKDKDYARYGGKGVLVCDEWQDFIPFRDWALANGYEDVLTIDRIDPAGNYCPNNCRWITLSENSTRANKPRGEQNGSAKLDWLAVNAIRSSTLTRKRLADFFGVGQTTISKIQNYKTWSVVPHDIY